MKEFLEMAKEQKMEIPERLQKCLQDQTSDTRDSLKEQQRRINKHRNVLHKLENKKKAIEKDNERWNTWVNTMKQEIQQQRKNHETVQKKLQKELNDLIDEEKKLREQEDHEIEEEDPKSLVDELETLLEGAPLGPADHGGDHGGKDALNKQQVNAALELMQKNMEERYQQQLDAEKEKLRNEMKLHMQKMQENQVIAVDDDKIKAVTETKRDALVPFGVQRAPKNSQASSPKDGSFDAQGKGEGRADRPQSSGVAEDGEGGFSNDGTLGGVVCHSPFSWCWNPLFFDGDGYFDFGRFLRTSLQNNVFVCLWMIVGDLVIFGCTVLPQGETEDSFPCGETQTL